MTNSAPLSSSLPDLNTPKHCLYHFSPCNEEQMRYHKLSTNVDEFSYAAAIKLIRHLYLDCDSSDAWNSKEKSKYQNCTSQITGSNVMIDENVPHIEIFALHHNKEMSIQVQLEQEVESVITFPDTSLGLQQAINYIKSVSYEHNPIYSCYDTADCFEVTREIVVRLKMIEWGLFGLGEATAGLYLAYHFSKIGPYFGEGVGT